MTTSNSPNNLMIETLERRRKSTYVDLDTYGYPGYRISKDRRIIDITTGAELKINNTSCKLVVGKKSIWVSLNKLYRQVYENWIEEVPECDKYIPVDLGLGNYVITRDGRAWSNYTYKWLSIYHSNGPRTFPVVEPITSRSYAMPMSYLVAYGFVPNPYEYSEIDYRDGSHHNIHDDNIYWVEKSSRNWRHPSLFDIKDFYSIPEEDVVSLTDIGFERYRITRDKRIFDTERLRFLRVTPGGIVNFPDDSAHTLEALHQSMFGTPDVPIESGVDLSVLEDTGNFILFNDGRVWNADRCIYSEQDTKHITLNGVVPGHENRVQVCIPKLLRKYFHVDGTKRDNPLVLDFRHLTGEELEDALNAVEPCAKRGEGVKYINLDKHNYPGYVLWYDNRLFSLSSGRFISLTSARYLNGYTGISVPVGRLHRELFQGTIATVSDNDKKELSRWGFSKYTLTRDGNVWCSRNSSWRIPYTRASRTTSVVGMTCDKGKHHQVSVVELLATTFVPNPNNYHHLAFVDDNPTNICVENLQWTSHSKFVTWLERSKRSQEEFAVYPKHQVKSLEVYGCKGSYICRDGRVYDSAKKVFCTIDQGGKLLIRMDSDWRKCKKLTRRHKSTRPKYLVERFFGLAYAKLCKL